ncbi:PIN domain-containing protein [Paracoccus aestuarii]|uniref:Ribonuclease VapC n=1 Tax=Paracoccus aestuarii TaxID=453842 RepID=A0A418ZVW0_9RHOB|nr:PIN domain-containing protein [Paracoccus aestuarii]RJL04022.1 PIN domain-containing protein [Paracoccus aestuarii]WCR01059.1 PIN domain-containing protein [Paracoccus aestuarii]
MSVEFVDTNVILYLLDDGPKADRAEAILAQGPRISVQVLNEAMVNCRRKAGMDWNDTASFLAGVRALCPVEDLTLRTHDVGRALAERYGFSVYDAMIVAAALIAGCETLWTEDMHAGLLVEGQLRLVNPFA